MQYLILLLASTTDMDVSDGGQKQLDPELQGESGDSDMDTDVREKEGAVRGERRGRVKRGRAERGDGSRRGRGGGTGGRAQGRERERGRGRGRGRARGEEGVEEERQEVTNNQAQKGLPWVSLLVCS